jgi:hypothetical protein
VEEWGDEEGYLIATPHGRGDWFYHGPGERDVLDVIADVATLHPVDQERVYLMGHSMGGYGTWHLAAGHPDLFAGIVPMATWPPEGLLPAVAPLRPLVLHGDADAVVPVDFGRRAANHLELLGGEFRYVESAGVGHESELITYSLPVIGDWLRDQKRETSPTSVSVRAYTPRRGKAWWVCLQEVGRFGALASIDALAGPRRVDVITQNVIDFAVDPPLSDEARLRPLTLSVDGEQVHVPPIGTGNVVFLRKVNGLWKARLVPESEFRVPSPKPVAKFTAAGPGLPERVGAIISKELGVDGFLINHDLIAPHLPAGQIHEDHILDLFLRPEDELHLVEIEKSELEKLMAEKAWYPAYWGKLTLEPVNLQGGGKPVVIAMPAVLARVFPAKSQSTRLGMRRVLYEFLKREGEL